MARGIGYFYAVNRDKPPTPKEKVLARHPLAFREIVGNTQRVVYRDGGRQLVVLAKRSVLMGAGLVWRDAALFIDTAERAAKWR